MSGHPAKLKLESLCDRYYYPQRAAVARDIVYWILKHPGLYLSGHNCEVFFIMTCENKSLEVVQTLDYINSILDKENPSINPTFDEITLELLRIGAPKRLFSKN